MKQTGKQAENQNGKRIVKTPESTSPGTETAKPKLNLDWDSMQPYKKSGRWELLKTVTDKTQDDAVSVVEAYLYARCECGEIMYMPLDWLKSQKDCGCGAGTGREIIRGDEDSDVGARNRNAKSGMSSMRFGANGGVLGRPRAYKERTATVGFNCPVGIWEWMGEQAWGLRTSRSALIVNLMEEYKRQAEEGREEE